VTIGADDLALGDLVEYRLPATIPDAGADVEALVALMIELEHDWIRLSPQSTQGCAAKYSISDRLRSSASPRLRRARVLDVLGTVRDVMLMVVIGAARPAVVIALATGLPSPRKIVDRPDLLAAPAPPHLAGRL
jgi:hypothetical protein